MTHNNKAMESAGFLPLQVGELHVPLLHSPSKGWLHSPALHRASCEGWAVLGWRNQLAPVQGLSCAGMEVGLALPDSLRKTHECWGGSWAPPDYLIIAVLGTGPAGMGQGWALTMQLHPRPLLLHALQALGWLDITYPTSAVCNWYKYNKSFSLRRRTVSDQRLKGSMD